MNKEYIDRLGLCLKVKSSNIYNIEIPAQTLVESVNRLTNQLWKLIPMRENNEDWDKQLETVIIEISGLNKIFNSLLLQIVCKLEGLREVECSFYTYRKTIFECINLIQELKK